MSALNPRRLLVLAGLVLAGAAALEGGARMLDRARGRPFDRERVRAGIRQLCDALAEESSILPRSDRPADEGAEAKILQPYTAWEFPSTQRRAGLDVEYYEAAGGDAAGKRTFDVCVLGGTAAQTFAKSGTARFADALGRAARFQGRSVRVHDYSCRDYKQPQMSKLLAWLLALGHRPDAVVEIDGAEEIELGERNALAGTNPGYPSIEAWRDAAGEMRSDWEMVERLHRIRELRDGTRAFGEWLLDSGLWKSCFLGHVAELRLSSLERARQESLQGLADYARNRTGEEFRGPTFDRGAGQTEDAVANCWERATRSMRGLCSAQGIPFLLVVRDPSLRGRAAGLREKGLAVLDAPGTEDGLADALASALGGGAGR